MKYTRYILIFSLFFNFLLLYLLFNKNKINEAEYTDLVENFSGEIGNALAENYLEDDLHAHFKCDVLYSLESYFANFDPEKDEFVDKFNVLTDDQILLIRRMLKESANKGIADKEFSFKLAKHFVLYSIENYINRTYFQFNAVYVHAYSRKDTINLGEEYVAHIPYIGVLEHYKPTLIVNGDTVPTDGDSNVYYYKEIATQRGLIKNKGSITLFAGGPIIKLPFEFEYYVK